MLQYLPIVFFPYNYVASALLEFVENLKLEPTGICFLKVNSENTRAVCEINYNKDNKDTRMTSLTSLWYLCC